MPWEVLRPLRVLRGFDGVFVHPDGTIVLGVSAFEALGQPARVLLLLNREETTLGIKATHPQDDEGYGLYAPAGDRVARTTVNAIRAFRRLGVNPRSVRGAHDVELRDGILLLPVGQWVARPTHHHPKAIS